MGVLIRNILYYRRREGNVTKKPIFLKKRLQLPGFLAKKVLSKEYIAL